MEQKNYDNGMKLCLLACLLDIKIWCIGETAQDCD